MTWLLRGFWRNKWAHTLGSKIVTKHLEPANYMKILIGKNGQQTGPYNEEQLTELVNKGDISYDDLAWKEGMTEWQPLRQVVPPPAGSPPPLPPLAGTTHPAGSPPLSPRPSIPTPNYNAGNNQQPVQGPVSDGLGYFIVAIPILAAVLIWMGVMGSTVNVELLVIAIFVGLEAKLLGAGSPTDLTPKGKRHAGPIGWALTSLFLGPIGLCSYLYSRKRYGARNLLLPGLISSGLWLAAVMLPHASQSDIPMVEGTVNTPTVRQDTANTPGNPSIASKPLSSNQIQPDELDVRKRTIESAYVFIEDNKYLEITSRSEKPVTINSVKVNGELVLKWIGNTSEYKPYPMTMGSVLSFKLGSNVPGGGWDDFKRYYKEVIKAEIETDRGTLIYTF